MPKGWEKKFDAIVLRNDRYHCSARRLKCEDASAARQAKLMGLDIAKGTLRKPHTLLNEET